MGIEIRISYPKQLTDMVRVLHDYEAKDGLIRIGMPEVLSMALNQFCPWTERHQQFVFRTGMVHPFSGYTTLEESAYDKAKRDFLFAEWRSYTHGAKFLTNNKGTEIYADYISRRNLTKEPAAQEPLTCCGNIHRKLGSPFEFWDEEWQAVYTFDFSVAPPDYNLVNALTMSWMFPCATNVPAIKKDPKTGEKWSPAEWKLVYLSNGTWQVDEFPNLAPRDTRFPLATNGKEAQELERRWREKGIRHPAGTFTENGIRYAINYLPTRRLTEAYNWVSPYNK